MLSLCSFQGHAFFYLFLLGAHVHKPGGIRQSNRQFAVEREKYLSRLERQPLEFGLSLATIRDGFQSKEHLYAALVRH